MSDTPETDLEHDRICNRYNHSVNDYYEMFEFARKLERERDAAYAVLKSVREGYGGQVTDDGCTCDSCEFLRPIDAIIKL